MVQLLPIFKEHNLKSIHNEGNEYVVKGELLPIFKEHNLKSIHNDIGVHDDSFHVVTNIQRTQFKINSQPNFLNSKSTSGCYQYSKNTI